MNKFLETIVKEISHNELDVIYPFYGPEIDPNGDEVRNTVITPTDIWSETVSIDIDTAIDTLNELKKLGSDRVYLYAHTGHHGYVFTGVKLNKESDYSDDKIICTMVQITVPENPIEGIWGSKIEDYIVCIDDKEAKRFVSDFNQRNKYTYRFALSELKKIELTEYEFIVLNNNPSKTESLNVLRPKKSI